MEIALSRRMRMRHALVLLLSATPTLAAADTFGGFSGVSPPYLVNQDRVCTPIVVAAGAAAGAPKCEKAGADQVARLSIKPPVVQREMCAAVCCSTAMSLPTRCERR